MQIEKNSLVKKSNNLIETSQKLSLNEKRIIVMIIAQISKKDDKFKTKYQIKVKDIQDFLKLKQKTYYKEIRPAIRKLREREIIIKRPGGGELVTGWVSSVEYIPKDGNIEVSIDPKLGPYLLQLKKAYTQYKIEFILRLKKISSIRIYELMKQYEKIGERSFKIKEIRNYLGIAENKYKRFSNLKQIILLPAMKEINKKTDIKFKTDKKGKPEIYLKKEGRKVTGINLKLQIKENLEYQNIINKITEKDREESKHISNKIYSEKGEECLRWIIKKTNERKHGEDSNYAGYMHSLLKLGLWEKEQEKIQKETEKRKETENIAKTKAEKEIDEMGKIIKERKEKDELIKALTTEEDKELTKLAQSKLSGNLKTQEKLILNMKRSLIEEFIKTKRLN